MKKWISLLPAIILYSGVLVGCEAQTSDSPSAAEQPAIIIVDSEAVPDYSAPPEVVVPDGDAEVLIFAHYYDPDNTEDSYAVNFKKITDQFIAETGVQVEVEVVPWNQLDAKLIITNQAGEPGADLFYCSSHKMASFVHAGALLPLDDYFAHEDINDYNPLAIRAVTFPGDGKMYQALASIHSRGLWYNTDLMPVPPKTMDEMITIGQQVVKEHPDKYAFGFFANNHYGSIEVTVGPFIWAMGGKIVNIDGTAAWDTPQVAEAIKFLSDCVNVYKISPESVFLGEFSDIEDAFLAGNVASIINGTYMISSFLKESELGQAGKLKFVPIPGNGGPAPNFSNGWAFGIPTLSRQPDLAWSYISFFQRPEIQVQHALFEGGMPTRMSSYDDPAFLDPPFPDFVENMVANGHPMDPLIYYQEGLEAFNLVNIGFVLDPTQDLMQMLNDSAEEYNNRFFN